MQNKDEMRRFSLSMGLELGYAEEQGGELEMPKALKRTGEICNA